MSIRGTIVLECDSKGCRAEQVMDADEADFADDMKRGVQVELYFSGWVMDEGGEIHCPACCEERTRDRDEDDGMSYGHPDRLAGRE